jgi:hypothetical protein
MNTWVQMLSPLAQKGRGKPGPKPKRNYRPDQVKYAKDKPCASCGAVKREVRSYCRACHNHICLTATRKRKEARNAG